MHQISHRKLCVLAWKRLWMFLCQRLLFGYLRNTICAWIAFLWNCLHPSVWACYDPCAKLSRDCFWQRSDHGPRPHHCETYSTIRVYSDPRRNVAAICWSYCRKYPNIQAAPGPWRYSEREIWLWWTKGIHNKIPSFSFASLGNWNYLQQLVGQSGARFYGQSQSKWSYISLCGWYSVICICFIPQIDAREWCCHAVSYSISHQWVCRPTTTHSGSWIRWMWIRAENWFLCF